MTTVITAPLPTPIQRNFSFLRSKPSASSTSFIPSDVPSTLLPWISYYCNTATPSTCASLQLNNINNIHGVVRCPVCREHFPNSSLLQHFITHLLIDELYLGTLWPFEFCAKCLQPFDSHSLAKPHYSLHQYVHDPKTAFTLFDGLYVCPICEQTFPHVLHFALHLCERHVFRDSPYACPICYLFHASRYQDLLDHLEESHSFTNHLFCPYCLKYFQLPPIQTSRDDADDDSQCVFSAKQLFEHMKSHWNELTYRCEFCRLDFLHRRDLHVHVYLNHSGPPSLSPTIDYSGNFPSNFNSSSQLFLYYSNRLRTFTPRISLRCLECGEVLRQPISRHFNLTVTCPECRFSSSCIVAVHRHWCRVHSAPSIPSKNYPIDLTSELTSWERCVSSLVGSLRIDQLNKPLSTQEPFDYCGALMTRVRRCRHKHSPPGLEHEGLLQCVDCGFQTIVGNQMAKHLAVGVCVSLTAHYDRSLRIQLFRSVCRNKRQLLRTRKLWCKRLTRSPVSLQSVGLCRNI